MRRIAVGRLWLNKSYKCTKQTFVLDLWGDSYYKVQL